MVEEKKQRYEKHEKEAIASEQEVFRQHRTKSFIYAFIGLILITIGFIFQIIGAINA